MLALARSGQFDCLWYSFRIRLHGLDLGGASVEELGLSPQRSNMHANSGGPCLKRVFKALEIPEGSRIVDLGSGKGGALFTFCEFPFAEVVGVEVSEPLVRIARANASRLGLQNIRLICCDAAAFHELDRFSHVYMFNPFPLPVMREVMANIASSLVRQPRNLTLILKYPQTSERLVDSSVFPRTLEFSFPHSHPFYAHLHQCAAQSTPGLRP